MRPDLIRALDERLRLRPLYETLLRTRPTPYISPAAAPPFSLGRLSLFLFTLLVFSGLVLTIFYNPTAQQAAASIEFLHHQIPLGWLIHNTHRWSALILLLTVSLHVLRIWLERAFFFPRDLNWWIGVAILVTVLFMGGTGYLLRWDIKAFVLMDLIISNVSRLPVFGELLITFLLGGSRLDEVPLYRGYALHIWFLPLALFFLVGLHLLIVWRQGLATLPTVWQRLRERAHFTSWQELLPGLALLILVSFLAWITPHAGQPDPDLRSPWPHPDWLLVFYFLPFWFFSGEYRIIGAVILPVLLLAGLILAPRLTWLWHQPILALILSVLGILWVGWLFGQTAIVGARVPLQGCIACHQPAILGGAPTKLSEFKVRDPDWLIFHLGDPKGSLLVPFSAPLKEP